MDFLGFSEEELDKLNSQGSSKKTVEFSPVIEPIPDLSRYSDEVKAKYMQVREGEIARLKLRHSNQNPSIIPNEKNLNSKGFCIDYNVNKLFSRQFKMFKF